MRGELDVYGVLVPSLLLWLVVAYCLRAAIGAAMQRFGLYRLVWHRAMFDFALFVCLLGGVVYGSEFLS